LTDFGLLEVNKIDEHPVNPSSSNIFNDTSKIDVASTSSTDVKIADNEDCEATIIKDQWSVEMTKFILDTYEECLPMVGPMRKFKNKKNMWEHIAQKANNALNITKTAAQCENRYKTVLKRKRYQENNNKKSGASRQTVQFDDEIRKIASIDDTVIPEVLQSANICTINEKPNGKVLSKSKLKKETLNETIIRLHEIREANKKARHEEKMAFLREVFKK